MEIFPIRITTTSRFGPNGSNYFHANVIEIRLVNFPGNFLGSTFWIAYFIFHHRANNHYDHRWSTYVCNWPCTPNAWFTRVCRDYPSNACVTCVERWTYCRVGRSGPGFAHDLSIRPLRASGPTGIALAINRVPDSRPTRTCPKIFTTFHREENKPGKTPALAEDVSDSQVFVRNEVWSTSERNRTQMSSGFRTHPVWI